jgi:hypothetical protein
MMAPEFRKFPERGMLPAAGLTQHGDKTVKQGDRDDDDTDKGPVCIFHSGIKLEGGRVVYPEITGVRAGKLFSRQVFFWRFFWALIGQ